MINIVIQFRKYLLDMSPNYINAQLVAPGWGTHRFEGWKKGTFVNVPSFCLVPLFWRQVFRGAYPT